MSRRVIAVFTGNRAEYGLQLPLLRAIDAHPDLEYRLIVSGAHLDDNFGRTLGEIEADGFTVHAEVRIEMLDQDRRSTAHAIGSGVISMSECLHEIQPDMLVVYADRFEGFAAVIAGTQMNIPTAHIEGGDITEGGALDDSVRHAMTKLAHVHFTTNQQASNRLLAMGEEDWRVHTVGFPAIDLFQDNNYAKADDIQARLGLDLSKPVVLFTQHSVTTEFDLSGDQIMPSLAALETLAVEGVQIIATYPNNDAGGREIINRLTAWHKDCLARNVPNIQLHDSLGRWLYHGVLGLALDKSHRVVCVGNSSSGLKETPAFECPAVNIGSRQLGRLRANNVLDAGYDSVAICDAVRHCLYDDPFRGAIDRHNNPYGIGDAGRKMADVLASVALDTGILRKSMTLDGVASKDEQSGEVWFR